LIKVSILEVEEFTMDDQPPEAPQDKNNLEEVLAPTSTMGQPAEASQQDHKTSSGYEQEHEEWQKAKKKAKRRMNILRVIVLFAGASYYRMCWIDDEIWS
jgi:Zn-finger nucleic acid-binding protein